MDAQRVFENYLEAYREAVFRKDLDAYCALYAPEILVFDTWDDWEYRGLEAWRKVAREWFDSLGDERVTVRWDGLQAAGQGDLVVGWVYLTFAALDTQGKELRSLTNRLTSALRRQAGGWQVFHQQVSSPVDYRTGKPILKRGPGQDTEAATSAP